MDKRFPKGRAGEWRKQWLSGQPPCRTPIHAGLQSSPMVCRTLSYRLATRFCNAERRERDEILKAALLLMPDVGL